MTAIDVFIVNYNGRALLDPCLAALRAQRDVTVRLCVWDNASEDGSFEWLSSQGLGLVHRSAANIGYSAALAGLLEATQIGAEWIAFVTPDVVVQPDALAKMIEPFRWDSRLGFVAGVTEYEEGGIESAGIAYTRGGMARLRQTTEETGELFFPNGGFLMARREALADCGFDLNIFLYYEEVALGLRALMKGWKVALAPEARAVHHTGETAGRYPHIKARHLARSRQYILRAYWPEKWRREHSLAIRLTDAAGLIRGVSTGRLPDWLAGRREALDLPLPEGAPFCPVHLPVPWSRRLWSE